MNNMGKILNCVFSNAKGGLEQMFIEYSYILNDFSDLTCIVSPNFQYMDELEERGITYEILKVRNYYDVIAAVNFLRIIRKVQPDTIYSHNGRFHSTIALSKWFLTKIQNIGVSHGCLKRMMHFDKAIVVNTTSKQQLEHKGFQGKVTYLPNFTRVKGTDSPNSKKNDVFTFGLMSRLHRVKSIDIAIEAFATFLKQQQNPRFRLLIAGDGEEKEKLQKIVIDNKLDDKVDFLSWVDEKRTFYEVIDCFLLPSSVEPFGLTIIEAFAFHVPVIASNVEGPTDIIRHKKNGLLFEKNSVENLAEQMKAIYQDPQLIRKMVKNAKEDVRTKYNKDSFIQNLKEIHGEFV